jgi:DNA-binding NtrC family response regulator
MSAGFRALVVDDEELYARAIGRELSRRQIGSDLAFSAGEALKLAEAVAYQVVLLDHRLPDDDGLRLIPHLLASQGGTAILVMTAFQTIPNAVQAIRLGAEDYIVKEASLEPLVERVLEVRRRAGVRGPQEWRERGHGAPLGTSPGMVQVVEQLRLIARSPDTTVLLTGETGVGKEVAARFLHGISRPEGSPFVAVDCVALPANLAESLLFGHEKGAFTGADQTRVGAFEEARDGTVFLDEIGDMGEVQGKLLRVLEGRAFHRVGSMREIPLRARVVAATNCDLAEEVRRGKFREDLYQRLSVFPIPIPPLRERGEDTLLLAEHFHTFFAEKLKKNVEPLGEAVRAQLLAYAYPGNVRELKNIIERAEILAESGRVELHHLPRRVLDLAARGNGGAGAREPRLDFVPGIDTLDTLERRMIQQALRQAGNVKTEAAKLLGISRFQLLRRMEKYNIRTD